MRKIIFRNMVSLDGFFEGPNHEIDWHMVNDEFNELSIDMEKTTDTLIFGRITYELMASYWPTELALTDDPKVARMMNTLTKVVFSRTLKHVDWQNSRLVNGDTVEEITRLKQLPGKDMAIFGSANLAKTLIENNLIDEYQIFVNPVVLGGGRSLFEGIKTKLTFNLQGTKIFKNGLVLLTYQPDWK
ncbi:MAG: riboflavin biosynthesis protein RibD [Chloroflexi bacterium HGW-Chloroflexi-10]|nr:MAG: riboflavin biosynthesis protein RibD [Chloroflexi bacterium HGW-Chloroflexi-10]